MLGFLLSLALFLSLGFGLFPIFLSFLSWFSLPHYIPLIKIRYFVKENKQQHHHWLWPKSCCLSSRVCQHCYLCFPHFCFYQKKAAFSTVVMYIHIYMHQYPQTYHGIFTIISCVALRAAAIHFPLTSG